MSAVEFTLPWPPTVNTYYRMVIINGSPRMLLSKTGRAYKDCATGMRLREFKSDERVQVRITLHPPTKRRFDIDNRCKAVLDAIECAGILPDDEQVDRLIVERGSVSPQNGFVIVTMELCDAID